MLWSRYRIANCNNSFFDFTVGCDIKRLPYTSTIAQALMGQGNIAISLFVSQDHFVILRAPGRRTPAYCLQLLWENREIGSGGFVVTWGPGNLCMNKFQMKEK
jgi:hypothetical protein